MLFVSARRKRLNAVINRVGGLRNVLEADTDVRRREAIQAKLKEVERRHANRRKFDLSKAIAQAGLTITRQQFMIGAAISGAVCAILGFTLSPVAAVFLALIGALGLPRLFLSVASKRRVNQFTARFAEALDIIIRSVRSGLPLGESLNIIGREMPDPVGIEFRIVSEGIRLGMTMDESLARLSDRIPVAEVRFFAIVVGIQQQTGGNLAETLAKLSEVLRARKRMRDKIQALASEAKTSAIIIGSLPLVVMGILTVIAPDYVGLLFTTTVGHIILFAAAFVMGTGTVVMRGMINFEI